MTKKKHSDVGLRTSRSLGSGSTHSLTAYGGTSSSSHGSIHPPVTKKRKTNHSPSEGRMAPPPPPPPPPPSLPPPPEYSDLESDGVDHMIENCALSPRTADDVKEGPMSDIKTEEVQVPRIFVPPEVIGTTYEILSESDSPESPTGIVVCRPGPSDIVSHPEFNLEKLGISVNTQFKCVICLSCHIAVEPMQIYKHLHSHLSALEIEKDIGVRLTTKFGLLPLKQIQYPMTPTTPVFGVPVSQEKYFFCGSCHRGYGNAQALDSHKKNLERCDGKMDQNDYGASAQRLSKGRYKRYFAVQDPLPRRRDDSFDYGMAFRRMQPADVDYSQIPVGQDEDDQNLNQFLYRESWIPFIEGVSAQDIEEVCRPPNGDDPAWVRNLDKVSVRYLEAVVTLVNNHSSFGLCKAIANVSPT